MSRKYPLKDHHSNEIRSTTGRTLDSIDLGNLDSLVPGDLTIQAETLLEQAAIAQNAGYEELARNLRRAAELTRVPNDVLMEIYNALRPRRSTKTEMQAVANLLESTYDAPVTADFVRTAADAYQRRNLLRS